jgi:hypothetical protein
VTPAAALAGPVSAALESDLREWTRRQGVVVWLDLDGHYTPFVDRLIEARKAGELDYEVRGFRGSHLALMLSLEGVVGGVEKLPLVIHLPGFNEESVRNTPALELYEAGTRYRKALDTLVAEAAAGRVRPDQIAAFTSQNGMTLDAADAWLAALLINGDGGIAAQLRAMQPTAVLDDLLTNGFVAERIVVQPADEAAAWEQLAVWTGLPESWRQMTLPSSRARPEDMAFVAASWALAVEYLDDLKRAPVSPLLTAGRHLPRPVIDTCLRIATHLRERHATFYERTADETEALLVDEVTAARPEDLGKIDTFRFEEDKVLKGALDALAAGVWSTAAQWAALRISPKTAAASFWVSRDASRQAAWDLVFVVARVGEAIVRAGRLSENASLDAALDAYVDRGAAVDQAHRHLEQRRAALLYPQLPEFETFLARLDEVRQSWRSWADEWARTFNTVCRRNGFLPSSARQQRTIFDDVVKPLTQEAGTTAFFLVDAFRFEMGEELSRQFAETPATTVQLKARLAELPSVTEVGMNVLAPVASSGRLRPSLSSADGGSVQGFSTGEFRVFNPDTRKRAMHERVGGATCPWLTLEDVVGRDGASLRRSIAQARLVVVHNREIDAAGEAGIGPAVFDDVLQKLRAAWHLLREAGVRRFVLTGDHGFLLLDDAQAGPQTHGRRIDPKRRHVFSPVAADHTDEVRAALSDLGYEGVDGYVMFPESTAVFDTGKRAMSFVHGGNSLQERAIPVLTVVHRAAPGGSTLQYGITARESGDVAGMHCLVVTVDVAQGALDFGGAKELEVSLRALDVDDVQAELCQTRGHAVVVAGVVQARVGEPFELFFRLAGSSDARVQVELFHAGAVAEVLPCIPDARFAVSATRAPSARPAVVSAGRAGWLEQLPEGGVRQLFEHLDAHGTVTESEAASMLGSARESRRFALQFETLAQKAPWAVRIDVVAGVKRYVREGNCE